MWRNRRFPEEFKKFFMDLQTPIIRREKTKRENFIKGIKKFFGNLSFEIFGVSRDKKLLRIKETR